MPVSMDDVWRQVGVGGADGSVLLTPGEAQRSENRGLGNIGHLLLSWHDSVNSVARSVSADGANDGSDIVSVADLVQMAAIVATVTCPGGPRIRAFVGRRDVDPAVPPPSPGLIPPPTSDAATLIAMFHAKTFAVADLVALIGAHTVSRQFFVDPALAGQPQDSTHGVFDTRYYAETDTPDAPRGVYRFSADVSLAADDTVRPLWQQFAQEDAHQRWTEVYARAYVRLSLLGVQNINNLTDCSAVVPQAKPVP